MSNEYQLTDWFLHNWSRASLVTTIILLVIAPLVYLGTGIAVFLIFLWLPFYMLHQYEEHADGKLIEYYQKKMPDIAPYLSKWKLLIVNIVFIWLMFLISIYCAFVGKFALALYAPYVSLVNALVTVAQALRWRAYSPGLWTALLLFLPGATLTILVFSVLGTTRTDNLVGFGLGVLAHIFFFALGRGWVARSL